VNKKEFLETKRLLEKKKLESAVASIVYYIDRLLERGVSKYINGYDPYGGSIDMDLPWDVLKEVKKHYEALGFEVSILEKSRTFYEWWNDLCMNKTYTVIELK
jgi:hypothetical protein